MITTEQAVSLAEKHGVGNALGTGTLVALLNDHRQQIIEQLAAATGVMPWVMEFDNEHHPKVCNADEVREAIATMQAQNKLLKAESNKRGVLAIENGIAKERAEARVEEVERDRDEWKDSTISANVRFEIAERKLEQAEARVEQLQQMHDSAAPVWQLHAAQERAAKAEARVVELEKGVQAFRLFADTETKRAVIAAIKESGKC